MKKLKATHSAVASAPERIPKALGPEIAVVGRSNVGKSSFINEICGQKDLARVSKTPGRTRELHFFTTLSGFTLVDLPGYGFAHASKEDKTAWGKLLEAYFKNRPELKLVISLLDARHPASSGDEQMHDFLRDCDVLWEPVATKIDKLNQSERAKNLEALRLQLGISYKPMVFSAVNGEGNDRVLGHMIACAKGYVGNPT